MFLISPIKRYFNQCAAERQQKKDKAAAFETARNAINSCDVNMLKTALTRHDWSYRQVFGLFHLAVATDDPEIFSLVLDNVAKGNPNHRLFTHSGFPEGPNYSSEISLLSLAIANHKERIALALANNSKTDVTKQSKYTSSVYQNGRVDEQVTYSPSVAEHALENDMPAVAAVIYGRLEEVNRAKRLALEIY